MKLTVLSLLAMSLLTAGCATTSDLKKVDARLVRVEVAETCVEYTLDALLTIRAMQSPRVQSQPELMMEAQLHLQAIQGLTEQACSKMNEQRSEEGK